LPRRNDDVALLLSNIARLLALQDDSAFRIRAYLDASQIVATMPEDVEDLAQSRRLTAIPGIGPSIAGKIAEYLQTGRSSYFEGLKRQFLTEATELLDVPSIGPARAHTLHDELGISTIAELLEAAREHRLRALPGFGPRLEERIAQEAERAAAAAGNHGELRAA
jgi:DNA polymerase (family 10)